MKQQGVGMSPGSDRQPALRAQILCTPHTPLPRRMPPCECVSSHTDAACRRHPHSPPAAASLQPPARRGAEAGQFTAAPAAASFAPAHGIRATQVAAARSEAAAAAAAATAAAAACVGPGQHTSSHRATSSHATLMLQFFSPPTPLAPPKRKQAAAKSSGWHLSGLSCTAALIFPAHSRTTSTWGLHRQNSCCRHCHGFLGVLTNVNTSSWCTCARSRPGHTGGLPCW
jgi:hypothetical protein